VLAPAPAVTIRTGGPAPPGPPLDTLLTTVLLV
jgi:hypothetical protein